MITADDITVVSPYGAGGQLGKSLNRHIEAAPTEWVLTHDFDVLLKLHPNPLEVCAAAINARPDAGLFFPWVTALGQSTTTKLEDLIPPDAPKPLDSIKAHLDCAREVWNRYGWSVTEIPNGQIGGAVHLTSKRAWVAAGGYPGIGHFGEDHDYCKAVTAAGFAICRIDGWYVYHMGSIKGHREPSWVDGGQSAYELYQAKKKQRRKQ